MGKQQYLERLALGRSAFEDADINPVQANGASPQDQTAVEDGQPTTNIYEQQYDDKGRPINQTTEERNEAMRDAQNSVLELVGVVESKDLSDKDSEMKYMYIRKAREEVLREEQDRGEDLELVTNLLHAALTWWPEMLVARIQCGFYASSGSFADIILNEIRTAGSGGSGKVLATLFAGVPACALCALLKTLLCAAVGEGIGRFQKYLLRKRFPRRTTRRINTAITVFCEALVVGIDAAMLPLEYFGEVQRLGLAPTWPLLPHWRLFWPTSSPDSMHSFLWTSNVGISALRMMCSPASLLLVNGSLVRDQDEENPIGSEFTKFVYPPINEPASNTHCPHKNDPFGRVLHFGYRVRLGIMRWFGWKLQYISEHPQLARRYENNHLPRGASTPEDVSDNDSSDAGGDGLQHIHRSTTLAHQSVQYLAQRMDELYANLLKLPFESLILRSMALSYMASPLVKTPAAIAAAPFLYRPFGGGPFGRLGIDGNLTSAASYLSKLGLGIAVHCTSEIGVFFLVYKLTRWQGIRNFNWGHSEVSKPGRMGRLTYRLPYQRHPD